ncbi:type II toxin-antitoxin system prevent-host-death family antitoxin [Marinobacter sp.]|uniref:type II toxin-antitoxin system Phd/YefM family antitoxin n=1 Tax=Marinobacter sp. TaxID=50741 RepID=UPI002B49ABE7|nr:type II toxin-antitoxin system prevent-host-death family antitoxin [Marinobacter sp.]HKK56409.1 type II toxin-antitoxin system prevent-host-death family antitoxin [Marinobacter sp.]
MESVNMHEAKTRLSQLVARAAKGEAFIIAKAGKPVARVTAYDSPEESQQRRLGFMAGEFTVPGDFDRMGQDEIADMFGG